MTDPVSHKASVSAGKRQSESSTNGGSRDPNIAGWKPTTGTLPYEAGSLNGTPENEDYKDFLLQGKVPASALGTDRGDDYDAHDPPAVPAVTRRDGGSHSGWGRGGG